MHVYSRIKIHVCTCTCSLAQRLLISFNNSLDKAKMQKSLNNHYNIHTCMYVILYRIRYVHICTCKLSGNPVHNPLGWPSLKVTVARFDCITHNASIILLVY